MGTCGDCKKWNTSGFGVRKVVSGNEQVAAVGRCELVAKNWYPPDHEKMISLTGLEYTNWPVSNLITVVTRRGFGCNQFESNKEEPA